MVRGPYFIRFKPAPLLITHLMSEFIGTFFLILTVSLCLQQSTTLGNFAPIGIGFMFCSLVFAFGYISSAVMNPAVGLSFWLLELLGTKKTILYAIVQVISALCAAFLGWFLLGNGNGLWAPVPRSDSAVDIVRACMAEFVYTFGLMTMVLNVACSRQRDNQHYGLGLGFFVASGAFCVGSVSGAAFNPALATALQIVTCIAHDCRPVQYLWLYWIFPTLGTTTATFVFAAMHPVDLDEDDDYDEEEREDEEDLEEEEEEEEEEEDEDVEEEAEKNFYVDYYDGNNEYLRAKQLLMGQGGTASTKTDGDGGRFTSNLPDNGGDFIKSKTSEGHANPTSLAGIAPNHLADGGSEKAFAPPQLSDGHGGTMLSEDNDGVESESSSSSSSGGSSASSGSSSSSSSRSHDSDSCSSSRLSRGGKQKRKQSKDTDTAKRDRKKERSAKRRQGSSSDLERTTTNASFNLHSNKSFAVTSTNTTTGDGEDHDRDDGGGAGKKRLSKKQKIKSSKPKGGIGLASETKANNIDIYAERQREKEERKKLEQEQQKQLPHGGGEAFNAKEGGGQASLGEKDSEANGATSIAAQTAVVTIDPTTPLSAADDNKDTLQKVPAPVNTGKLPTRSDSVQSLGAKPCVSTSSSFQNLLSSFSPPPPDDTTRYFPCAEGPGGTEGSIFRTVTHNTIEDGSTTGSVIDHGAPFGSNQMKKASPSQGFFENEPFYFAGSTSSATTPRRAVSFYDPSGGGGRAPVLQAGAEAQSENNNNKASSNNNFYYNHGVGSTSAGVTSFTANHIHRAPPSVSVGGGGDELPAVVRRSRTPQPMRRGSGGGGGGRPIMKPSAGSLSRTESTQNVPHHNQYQHVRVPTYGIRAPNANQNYTAASSTPTASSSRTPRRRSQAAGGGAVAMPSIYQQRQLSYSNGSLPPGPTSYSSSPAPYGHHHHYPANSVISHRNNYIPNNAAAPTAAADQQTNRYTTSVSIPPSPQQYQLQQQQQRQPLKQESQQYQRDLEEQQQLYNYLYTQQKQQRAAAIEKKRAALPRYADSKKVQKGAGGATETVEEYYQDGKLVRKVRRILPFSSSSSSALTNSGSPASGVGAASSQLAAPTAANRGGDQQYPSSLLQRGLVPIPGHPFVLGGGTTVITNPSGSPLPRLNASSPPSLAPPSSTVNNSQLQTDGHNTELNTGPAHDSAREDLAGGGGDGGVRRGGGRGRSGASSPSIPLSPPLSPYNAEDPLGHAGGGRPQPLHYLASTLPSHYTNDPPLRSTQQQQQGLIDNDDKDNSSSPQQQTSSTATTTTTTIVRSLPALSVLDVGAQGGDADACGQNVVVLPRILPPPPPPPPPLIRSQCDKYEPPVLRSDAPPAPPPPPAPAPVVLTALGAVANASFAQTMGSSSVVGVRPTSFELNPPAPAAVTDEAGATTSLDT